MMIIIALLASCGILVGISYLMLNILTGIVVAPRTPVSESAETGEQVVPLAGETVSSMGVSRDGYYLAYIVEGEGEAAALHVAEISSGYSAVVDLRIEGTEAAWLGGTNSLVYEDSGDIHLLDVMDGVTANLTASEAMDGGPLPSPDGSLILWTRTEKEPTGSEPEYWLMNPDGSDQQLLAPEDSVVAWNPDSTQLISRGRVVISSLDRDYRDSLQRTEPGEGGWRFLTGCDGEVEYIWWPQQLEILYVSIPLPGEGEDSRETVFTVELDAPSSQSKLATIEARDPRDEGKAYYPSRTGRWLAYVADEGLECLDVEERKILRFPEISPTPPLTWREAEGAKEIYYRGPDGIYKVHILKEST